MLPELRRYHPRMLWRHINVEDIAFHDLSSHHRLVDRHGNLFPGTGLSHVFSLVLYPDNLSDPSSTTVDERILRLDDSIKHFDPDDSGIAPSENESLQQFDLSRSYEKVHLGLRSSQPLSIDPARILLKNMIDDISLEDWNLRYRDLLLGIRQQFHTERQDNSQIWVLDTHRLRLNNVPSRNITDIC